MDKKLNELEPTASASSGSLVWPVIWGWTPTYETESGHSMSNKRTTTYVAELVEVAGLVAA